MKSIFFIAIAGAVIALFLVYTFADVFAEPKNSRAPSSIPENYESLKACEKLDLLWAEMHSYEKLPDFREFGALQLLALSRQEIAIKGNKITDFAPVGWKKYLHGRGSIAKIKIVPKDSPYTGVFRGAECGLLRLSLTYKTAKNRAVAPGLALKILRDGTYSANISALVSLSGQKNDFNFFKNPMSNIVPMGKDFGQRAVHWIFQKASTYPEELLVDDLASINSHGEKETNVVSARQMIFVPGESLKFSSNNHDVREDFSTIPKETVIYQIYLVSDKYKMFNYAGNYTQEMLSKFLKESQHVADIVSTSEFVASEFGDDGIFFRHQLRP